MKARVLAACFVAVPRLALACPVCAGQTDAPLARATTLGVGVMLGVVVVVMGGLAALFLTLRGRAMAMGHPEC
ncbi:MAG: hypothetical protein ABL961_17060 [Vicinamibacterales bacterium]